MNDVSVEKNNILLLSVVFFWLRIVYDFSICFFFLFFRATNCTQKHEMMKEEVLSTTQLRQQILWSSFNTYLIIESLKIGYEEAKKTLFFFFVVQCTLCKTCTTIERIFTRATNRFRQFFFLCIFTLFVQLFIRIEPVLIDCDDWALNPRFPWHYFFALEKATARNERDEKISITWQQNKSETDWRT